MSKQEGITVKKNEDAAEWYQQVVLKAEFADYSPVKGSIVYRHWGYEIWENIQKYWDPMMKEHGVKNYYFPLLIPEALLKKEADHFEGFTPEVAWVTMAGDKQLDERLAVRPTSETIMYYMFSKWISSHRDLPLLTNQWCNVLRWETKMTKPFLRGREFLWHEAHTVHKTRDGAYKEAEWGLEGYRQVCEELLAIPVIGGRKTDSDRFPGAETTLAVEGLMPDGKALQMGTSHLLSQKFAETYGIKFLGLDEKWHHPWQTSWGTSTRMIGGLILAHGDDKGAVIPPRVAPVQVVIVPILFKGKESGVVTVCQEIETKLKSAGVRVEFDSRDGYTAGWKFNHWELKGVPLRIEIGPRDIEEKNAVVVRRDDGKKLTIPQKGLETKIKKELDALQVRLFEKLKKFLDENTVAAKTLDELKTAVNSGKWATISHCGQEECEKAIEEKVEGGPRVIPFDQPKTLGKCAGCSKDAKYALYWGKSY